MKEKLTVIIPTYNEEKDILECVNSLTNQTYKNFEIIIVDDGSTDNTIKKIIEFDNNIKILKQNHQGPGNARNLGVKNAKGGILIFVDADMTFDKNYLKKIVEPILNNEDVFGTTHELEIVKNTKNIWSRCWGKIRVSKEDAKEVKIFRAIRKKKFIELGGFDSKYGYADDQTFWFKYKIKPIVSKDTICYHKNPITLRGVYNQSIWIGASINNLLLKIPLVKYFIPFLLISLVPFIIPFLSIKKCSKINNFKILFPWMIIFITLRYFGTIKGLYNKIYLNINSR